MARKKKVRFTQAFLDSFKGMKPKDAEQKVIDSGYEANLVPVNVTAMNAIARPDTIILWQKDGVISVAAAGDPTQIVK